jgi:hypothetical protein
MRAPRGRYAPYEWRALWLAHCALLLVATAAALSMPARAQSGGSFDLTRNTVVGGGVMGSKGGDYTLSGTVGQADAGALTGDGYALAGGFWGGGSASSPAGYAIYLPLVLR